jgi:hypothetical protein
LRLHTIVGDALADTAGAGITLTDALPFAEEHPSLAVKVYVVLIAGDTLIVAVVKLPGIHVYVMLHIAFKGTAVSVAAVPWHTVCVDGVTETENGGGGGFRLG